MNLPEQRLKELQQLLTTEPKNAVQQIRPILKDFQPENAAELTDSQKDDWVGLMITYSDLLRQMIQTSDDLEEVIDVIEKIKLLCNKEASPFDWGVANGISGKLYMTYIHNFSNLEDARLVAIASFEEALTVKADDNYFINWLQAHIYLAEVYLIPGAGKNKCKALALLDRIFPATLKKELKNIAFEAKIASYPFPNTITKAKKKKDSLSYINRYSCAFFESLMAMGNLHLRNGNLSEAIIYYHTAKDVIKKLEGEASPLFRAIRDHLREMNYAVGNLVEGAIDVNSKERETVFQPFAEQTEEETYISQTDHFVDLYMEAKEYRTASELLAKALRICERINSNYPLLFTYKSRLGHLYLKSNLFTSSLKSYLGASLLYEKYLQDTDLPIAEVYDSIAQLLIDYFRFVMPAKYYLTKSLEIQSSRPSFTPHQKAKLHLMFARYYLGIKDVEKVQEYYNLYASEIRHINEQLNQDEPTPLDETVLGQLYESQGDYANAEKCYRTTKQRLEQSGTKEMEKIVLLHLLIGELCEKWKRPGISPFDFYMTGLDLATKHHAGGYLNLAKLHYRYGIYIIKYGTIQNVKLGMDILRNSAHKDSNYIAEVFAIGSEEHRAMMLEELYDKIFVMISVCFHYNINDPQLFIIIYNYVLRRKAINLKIDYLHKNEKSDRHKSEQLKNVQEKLYDCYDEISMAVITNASKAYLDNLVAKTKELLYQKELLVLQEIQILNPVYIEQFLAHEEVGSVFFNLPEDSAIIEFVKYKPFQFGQETTTGNSKKQRYMAMIGFCSMLMVKFVDVGDCDEIDQLLHNYRQAIVSNNKPDNDNNHIGIGKELRKKVFDIFLDKIENRKRIVIAPDGDLSFLPFESLPTEADGYLIDEYVFSYVNSGRDVLSFKMGSFDVKNALPVVMGNPKFSVTPDADLLEGELYFKKLSQTQKEIDDIAELLHVPAINQKEVSKKAILQLKSPKILHLATHGYNINGSNIINSYDLFYKSMFTNGLCVSGINDYLLSEVEDPVLGNGFLSAVNVLNMDLMLTELVVLSACDAGLGIHADGEGVLGLRRAFNIAGAKSLIMSLWKVPDKQTALLMHQFYERLLSGEARVHALRNAQLSIKLQYPSPIYWGSFICLGIPSKMGVKQFEQHSE